MMMTLRWAIEHCSSTNVQRLYVFNSNGETFIDWDSQFRNEIPYTAAAVAVRLTGLCKHATATVYTFVYSFYFFLNFQFTCK